MQQQLDSVKEKAFHVGLKLTERKPKFVASIGTTDDI